MKVDLMYRRRINASQYSLLVVFICVLWKTCSKALCDRWNSFKHLLYPSRRCSQVKISCFCSLICDIAFRKCKARLITSEMYDLASAISAKMVGMWAIAASPMVAHSRCAEIERKSYACVALISIRINMEYKASSTMKGAGETRPSWQCALGRLLRAHFSSSSTTGPIWEERLLSDCGLDVESNDSKQTVSRHDKSMVRISPFVFAIRLRSWRMVLLYCCSANWRCWVCIEIASTVDPGSTISALLLKAPIATRPCRTKSCSWAAWSIKYLQTLLRIH